MDLHIRITRTVSKKVFRFVDATFKTAAEWKRRLVAGTKWEVIDLSDFQEAGVTLVELRSLKGGRPFWVALPNDAFEPPLVVEDPRFVVTAWQSSKTVEAAARKMGVSVRCACTEAARLMRAGVYLKKMGAAPTSHHLLDSSRLKRVPSD